PAEKASPPTPPPPVRSPEPDRPVAVAPPAEPAHLQPPRGADPEPAASMDKPEKANVAENNSTPQPDETAPPAHPPAGPAAPLEDDEDSQRRAPAPEAAENPKKS